MRFPRRTSEEISLNLTPLIDVVFLLLIFFMVSTTFNRETQIEIDLPQAAQSTELGPSETIEVLISAQGEYQVDGKPLVNTQPLTLRTALLKAAGERRDLPLRITADSKTPHQAVVTAMDMAGMAGFSKLSITTRQAETP